MTVKLLTEQYLAFLSLKGGCTGPSEPRLVNKATLLESTCRGSFVVDGVSALLVVLVHMLLELLTSLHVNCFRKKRFTRWLEISNYVFVRRKKNVH